MKGKMFALDELSDGSDSEPDSGSQDAQPAVLKKKAKAVTVEELLAAGYKAPDVKRVREPRPEEPSTWDWSNGRSAKQQEVQETAEELAATRHAATLGAEETARRPGAGLCLTGINRTGPAGQLLTPSPSQFARLHLCMCGVQPLALIASIWVVALPPCGAATSSC
ncbi:uncharacterized protein HaLaN_06000 [Haematococcus lacustris]|uniref:Uncharacterized protein n=1 Tax=Haematococcus lacustris TaxID=44745 RepID=A0A699YKQ3_HAELA|nr:uncharacterized protein HaLaN_06000 [Haematococcus lacustris]